MSDLPDDFYVTLPSNVSPDSSPADFSVRLGERLTLQKSSWTCGLSEVLYSGEMQSLPEAQTIKVTYKNGLTSLFSLPKGNYKTNASLIAALNSLPETLSRKRRNIETVETLPEGARPVFPELVDSLPPGAKPLPTQKPEPQPTKPPPTSVIPEANTLPPGAYPANVPEVDSLPPGAYPAVPLTTQKPNQDSIPVVDHLPEGAVPIVERLKPGSLPVTPQSIPVVETLPENAKPLKPETLKPEVVDTLPQGVYPAAPITTQKSNQDSIPKVDQLPEGAYPLPTPKPVTPALKPTPRPTPVTPEVVETLPPGAYPAGRPDHIPQVETLPAGAYPLAEKEAKERVEKEKKEKKEQEDKAADGRAKANESEKKEEEKTRQKAEEEKRKSESERKAAEVKAREAKVKADNERKAKQEAARKVAEEKKLSEKAAKDKKEAEEKERSRLEQEAEKSRKLAEEKDQERKRQLAELERTRAEHAAIIKKQEEERLLDKQRQDEAREREEAEEKKRQEEERRLAIAQVNKPDETEISTVFNLFASRPRLMTRPFWFTLDTLIGRAVCFLREDVSKIEFSDDLTYMLGFKKSLIDSDHVAEAACDCSNGKSLIYIYSDICDYSLCAGQKTNILRAIRYEPSESATSQEFLHVRYIPLLPSQIDSIRIKCFDSVGRPIRFDGVITLVIHFRRL